MAETMLTVDDVADKLKLSSRTVRRLIYKGELEHAKIGHSVRVKPEWVDQMIDAATGDI